MIRKALKEDAEQVVRLMCVPMMEVARYLTGKQEDEAVFGGMTRFYLREDTQYSYVNTLVYVADGSIAGSITAYDGAKLDELRKNAFYMLAPVQGAESPLSDETEAGEYYIDTLSVDPAWRGKGIAGRLIEAVCQRAADEGHKRMGLIVDPANEGARRLYARSGFEEAGTRDFFGTAYIHMIKDIE